MGEIRIWNRIPLSPPVPLSPFLHFFQRSHRLPFAAAAVADYPHAPGGTEDDDGVNEAVVVAQIQRAGGGGSQGREGDDVAAAYLKAAHEGLLRSRGEAPVPDAGEGLAEAVRLAKHRVSAAVDVHAPYAVRVSVRMDREHRVAVHLVEDDTHVARLRGRPRAHLTHETAQVKRRSAQP